MAKLEMHLIWQVNMYDPPQVLPLPKIINLLADLKEEREAMVLNTWITNATMKINNSRVSSWSLQTVT